jgi:hypothetical protein
MHRPLPPYSFFLHPLRPDQSMASSVWQTQKGGLLKVLSVDAAEISRSFISSPTAPVQRFPIGWLEAFEALGSSRHRGTGLRIAT